MNRKRLLFAPAILLVAGVLCPPMAAQGNIYLKNTAAYDSGRYLWTVYVEGDQSSINNISYVEYTLHYSFPKPIQQIRERGGKCPFALSSNSWGEFEIKAKIVFKNNDGARDIKYWLDLLKNKTSTSVCSATKPKRARRR